MLLFFALLSKKKIKNHLLPFQFSILTFIFQLLMINLSFSLLNGTDKGS